MSRAERVLPGVRARRVYTGGMLGSSAPYEMVRREDVCAATGRAFQPGDAQVVVLVERPGEEALTRVAYTAESWDDGARPASPDRVFGFWRRVAGEDTRQPDPVMSPEELFDLFVQLDESDEPRQVSFRYLLTLLLMRKRRLVCEGVERGDPDRLVVKARPGGEVYRVVDPSLDDATIAEASEELGRVLRVGDDA